MIDFATLYSWVRDLPIVDWHNHLDMKMLAEDRPLGSLHEAWVKSDPYKHRAMRICGEPERLITGDASEAEKWAAWMRTLPKLVGNPIFAWARMELGWLGLDPEPYLHGRGENVSLSDWTPSKMLRKFGVEHLSPCVVAQESLTLGQRASRLLNTLGQRASCPLDTLGQRASCPLNTLGQRASCPLNTLGQRASCPLTWTASAVKEFPSAQASVSSHFSHTLASGTFHRRNLPHIGQSATIVFVTFRLADSLPQTRLDELAAFKEEWLRCHPLPWDEAACREWESASFPKIEEWLDAGHGSCILADPVLRKVVEDALEHFNDAGPTDAPPVGEDAGPTDVPPVGEDAGPTDVPPVGEDAGPTDVPPVGEDWDNGRPARWKEGDHLYGNGQDARCPSVNGQDARCPSVNGQDARCPSGRYRLHSYVVMPNHVHVLFELFDGADIQKILHSWKSFTAKKLNQLTGCSGQVWKEEYYDRLIRNGEHYSNTIRYIRRNGESAKTLAKGNGRDARCPSVNGQDARCPSVNGQDARCPSVNGQDARCPSVNGQDARCPSVVPSLRMNVGDEVSVEALEKFHAAGCRVVDVSVDDVSRLCAAERGNLALSAVASYAAAHGWTMLLHLGALRETSARLRRAAGPAGGFAGMRAPVDPAAVAGFLNMLEAGTTGVPPVGEDWDNGRLARWKEGDHLYGNGQDARCPSMNGQDARCPSVNGQDARCPSVNGQDARCPSMNGQDARCPSVNGQDARCPSVNGQDARCCGSLPRTILMSLNPEAHASLAVLAGSFNEAGIPGKVQLGPAWWLCDHEEGIRDVLEKNAAYGVLSTFVGMTTDSRSLLSFVRHDYFRRILCRWVAEKVASGAFPDDESLLRPMLENICYRNAHDMVFGHDANSTRSTRLKTNGEDNG